MKKRASLNNIIITIIMLILLVFILHPFLWLLISTFKNEPDLIKSPPTFFSKNYTFLQYIKVWHSIPLLSFMKNTVIFAGSVTILSVLFDSMAGYAFARLNFKGSKILFTFILITMMIPFQVVMIPLFVEEFKLSILNTFTGLILPRTADAFGIFLMRSFFITLPKDLEEAGRIDGCSEFRIFFQIMLPLCKPGIITLGIFNLMGNWNDLLYPLMLTSSTEMRTLSAGLAMFVGNRTIEYGPTLAASIIALLPLLIIYIFAQRYFIQGVATTGLKS